MSKVDVRTGTHMPTPPSEGTQEYDFPETIRGRRVQAAIGVLDLTVGNKYPDILEVPDTIAAAAQSADAERAAAAARASTPVGRQIIQEAVNMQNAGQN